MNVPMFHIKRETILLQLRIIYGQTEAAVMSSDSSQTDVHSKNYSDNVFHIVVLWTLDSRTRAPIHEIRN